ncbi:MAG: tetratricopeptide repeat protein [Cytophagales bacterium]|nr:MAG: tetratricopeptide repeat protein [Cytophagales bacterium]
MQSLRILLLIMSLFAAIESSIAQTPIDSLLRIVKNQKGEAQINTLNQISKAYFGKNPDSALYIATKALKLAEKENYDIGKVDAIRCIGVVKYIKGNIIEALQNYQEALKLAEEIGYKKGIADNCNNIGVIYASQKEYEKALEYYQKDLKIEQELENEEDVAFSMNNIGVTYLSLKQYDKALEYQNKALDIQKKINDPRGIAASYQNIGEVYQAQEKYEDAFKYLNLSLQAYEKIGEKLEILYPLLHLASLYQIKNQDTKAKEYALRVYALAKEIGASSEILEASTLLYEIFKKEKNFEQALLYNEIAAAYKDSLSFKDVQLKITQKENEYKYQEKVKDAKKQQELKQNSIYLLGIGFIMTLILLAIVYYFQQKGVEAQKIIKIQNQKIEDAYTELAQQNEQIKQQNFNLETYNKKLQQNQKILNKAIQSQKIHQEELRLRNVEILQQKEELQSHTENIEQLNTMKDKLFSIVSHDLRGPINSIKALLDLLQEGFVSPQEFDRFLPELNNNIQNTVILTDNLLFWAKNQLDGLHTDPESIDLKIIAENNITLFKNQAQRKQINIQNTIEQPLMAWADKNMVDLVVRNLVGNAIKFCSERGNIAIQAQIYENTHYRVSVKDDGVGIPATQQEKLFHSQGITTLGTHQEKGTGLGLLLCREFVEKNGGNIGVRSEMGQGSEFFFTLPKA